MKTVRTRSKAALLLSYVAASAFVLAGCSSDDAAPVTDITVSGVITDTSETALTGVGVEGVYSSPDQASNPTATTDASGFFSMVVDAGRAFYLHGTFAGYATMNSEKVASNVNIANLEIGIPTEAEAQAIIDTAFPLELPQLGQHAWLVVDIEDGNGIEVNDVAVEFDTSVIPADSAYTDCDGTDSGGSLTTGAPCTPDREAPMYIAYFDSTSEITVTVSGETKIAPVRLGEVTFLEFDVTTGTENSLPVAVNDAFNVAQGDTTNLNLAANDSDADDGLDLASITIVASPANGTVVVNTDGTVDYTHDPSATITDTFSYAISDNSGAISNTATVTLTVFGNVAAGQVKYDAACAGCHAAGSHDTVQDSASDLYDDGEKLVTDLSSIGGMGSVPDITVQELIDLKAFLEDPTTAP